jgi:hypothetical protein
MYRVMIGVDGDNYVLQDNLTIEEANKVKEEWNNKKIMDAYVYIEIDD